MLLESTNKCSAQASIPHATEHSHLLILTMKANKMHYFSNLFDKVLYMFRTGPLSISVVLTTLADSQQN